MGDIRNIQPLNYSYRGIDEETGFLPNWYEIVLKRHIDRILLLMSLGNEENFCIAVKLLDAFLSPERDTPYEMDMLELKEKILKEYSNLNLTDENIESERSLLTAYSIKLFENLCKLMKRKGIMPKTLSMDTI